MPIFRKLIRKIKFRMAGEGLSLFHRSAEAEKDFLEDCKQKVQAGNPTSLISFAEKSPIMGEDIITSKLDELAMTNKEFLGDDIDEMRIKVSDIFITPSLFMKSRQINSGLKTSFKELEQNDSIDSNNLDKPPNWDELLNYAREEFGIQRIGFTKVPRELIFQGKYILFPYALVLIEEMRKGKIDTAPLAPAGLEAIRVYARLGKAVIAIARWLRERGVRCQPNHPTGGLVVTPPLAAKAGLGWQGRMGLLITPEFGVRQRIATIFLEQPIFEFTDSLEHQWIEEYCKGCGLCAKRCPGEAILEQKIVNIQNIEGIGQERTCVDLMKCYRYFSLGFGCSVCVKVCPFSQGSGSYERIKKYFDRRTKN